jgi:hypothetical protein
LGDFISWTSKFKVLEKREIMVIDEKPKLENNDDIDTRIIDEMISNVKMISGSKSMGVKSTLEKELLNAKVDWLIWKRRILMKEIQWYLTLTVNSFPMSLWNAGISIISLFIGIRLALLKLYLQRAVFGAKLKREIILN